DASGPGAGCYPGSPPTCSAGVNPGTAPGLSVYPAGPQPSWPNAGKPYEYWLLWPAPAHSTSLNAIYYDPRLTYDPPVDATGASYTYPWAPPSFVLSASPGAVVTNTYAAQKVTLTTDPAYTNGGKLYGTGFGTAVSAAWANAQDAKYFYENENVIWCDPTSPS